ncbi:Cytochrome c oxidase assembly factor CtaG [Halopseudomonas xinjiangensis]|uniref:Cytochrome c oxidase assembly factor CtaG n=2 Tax=Halopseudomonas xinjiangensis TaxID=487184 RepID=A0A1H1VF05_9GAMM|nr:Cytochrome c oxidase assembly factor CtaG [Halopseudomonas xinjiangensis]
MTITRATLLGLLLAVFAPLAWAHSPFAAAADERLPAWLTAGLLLVLWACYLRGCVRVWPGAGAVSLFHVGLALGGLAVLGPLDDWAETSTSAHMTQHMVFMVVVPPLFVLSRPLPQLSAGGARRLSALWNPLLRLTQRPMLTAYVHGFIVWFWHTPKFYMLAVEHPWWHAVEHLLFIVSAGLFWWAVLRSSRLLVPWALLALLFTLMHTGFLGALLTFAREPLYGEARSLEDQQLAGLIMWVLGAIPYLLGAGWLGWRWLLTMQRRIGW